MCCPIERLGLSDSNIKAFVQLFKKKGEACTSDTRKPRHLGGQFGFNPISNPTSIQTLILPFFPRESAVNRNFGYARDAIKLVGAWNTGRDDRNCSISYYDVYGTALATLDDVLLSV